MTDLSKASRAWLDAEAIVSPPEVLSRHDSADGTVKWLFNSGSGQAVETVFIPEPGRGTLCISSQVGCALDCAFCATGAQGFNRNLTSAEIIGQVWHASRELPRRADGESALTNVVFMGMGEPLANYRHVLAGTAAAGIGQGLRAVTAPRHRQHFRHRAAYRQARRRRATWRLPCRCTHPTMRCATRSCR